MNEREKLELLKLLMDRKKKKDGSDPEPRGAMPIGPQELFHKYKVYSQGYDLHAGDLVQWKPGMKNRKKPNEGELGIIVNALEQPVYPSLKKEADAGSPLFREPLTLAVGMLDSDGEFIVCHYDKNRFMPAYNSASASHEGSRLQQLFTVLTKMAEPFQPGDLVHWKPGLKNKKRPAENETCVVLEVLPAPVYDMQKSAGTPYFLEPLSLKLGLLDSDGEFMVFHYDARRFEKIQ
eukprot:TRINITY_DN1547_c0_g1_i1.p1 TRINITY_DN1547_c0_g1~~TRINITY_DN1547_c0_g1_i1.p1  ORF type:complete len:253 (+),score=81.00 TRINITY_DN1547_c0_g1_i1:57-761(+)